MFLLSRTSGAFKSAQVNCMIITSSMCPIQLFQTRFQLYCRQQHFNSFDKEEHLKGNRVWNVFLVHFSMDPDSQSPFDVVKLLKKMFEEVWDCDFERSEQLKFAKFLRSAPTMVAPCGSLNSWNQWINDRPLYQSLFRPLQVECFLLPFQNLLSSTTQPAFGCSKSIMEILVPCVKFVQSQQ